MLRQLPIAAELLNLVAAGPCDPVMIWEERDGRRQLTDKQEQDEETGELLWTAYVIPTAAEKPEVLQVRVRARQQPVLSTFGPVAVDNLMVNTRVGKDGKLAQYWEAASIRDAGPQPQRKNGHPEHKPVEQSA